MFLILPMFQFVTADARNARPGGSCMYGTGRFCAELRLAIQALSRSHRQYCELLMPDISLGNLSEVNKESV